MSGFNRAEVEKVVSGVIIGATLAACGSEGDVPVDPADTGNNANTNSSEVDPSQNTEAQRTVEEFKLQYVTDAYSLQSEQTPEGMQFTIPATRIGTSIEGTSVPPEKVPTPTAKAQTDRPVSSWTDRAYYAVDSTSITFFGDDGTVYRRYSFSPNLVPDIEVVNITQNAPDEQAFMLQETVPGQQLPENLGTASEESVLPAKMISTLNEFNLAPVLVEKDGKMVNGWIINGVFYPAISSSIFIFGKEDGEEPAYTINVTRDTYTLVYDREAYELGPTMNDEEGITVPNPRYETSFAVIQYNHVSEYPFAPGTHWIPVAINSDLNVIGLNDAGLAAGEIVLVLCDEEGVPVRSVDEDGQPGDIIWSPLNAGLAGAENGIELTAEGYLIRIGEQEVLFRLPSDLLKTANEIAREAGLTDGQYTFDIIDGIPTIFDSTGKIAITFENGQWRRDFPDVVLSLADMIGAQIEHVDGGYQLYSMEGGERVDLVLLNEEGQPAILDVFEGHPGYTYTYDPSTGIAHVYAASIQAESGSGGVSGADSISNTQTTSDTAETRNEVGGLPEEILTINFVTGEFQFTRSDGNAQTLQLHETTISWGEQDRIFLELENGEKFTYNKPGDTPDNRDLGWYQMTYYIENYSPLSSSTGETIDGIYKFPVQTRSIPGQSVYMYSGIYAGTREYTTEVDGLMLNHIAIDMYVPIPGTEGLFKLVSFTGEGSSNMAIVYQSPGNRLSNEISNQFCTNAYASLGVSTESTITDLENVFPIGSTIAFKQFNIMIDPSHAQELYDQSWGNQEGQVQDHFGYPPSYVRAHFWEIYMSRLDLQQEDLEWFIAFIADPSIALVTGYTPHVERRVTQSIVGVPLEGVGVTSEGEVAPPGGE